MVPSNAKGLWRSVYIASEKKAFRWFFSICYRTIVLSQLDDKRIVRDRMRVCDLAASYLVKSESELLSENGRKVDFDMSGKPKDKNKQVGVIKKQLQISAIIGKRVRLFMVLACQIN